MKTQRELNQHYWGILHEMVGAYNKTNSADVKPWECVRYDGALWSEMAILSAPQFDQSSARYQFAVAILYDEQAGVHRPIFENDRLFLLGEEAIAEKFGVKSLEGICYFGYGAECFEKNVSWHKPKPKRTFEINGVELPCHVRKRTPHTVNLEHDGVWVPLYFETLDEASEFYNKLRGIFINARDLE